MKQNKEKRKIKFSHCSVCNPLGLVDYCVCPERQPDGSWKPIPTLQSIKGKKKRKIKDIKEMIRHWLFGCRYYWRGNLLKDGKWIIRNHWICSCGKETMDVWPYMINNGILSKYFPKYL